MPSVARVAYMPLRALAVNVIALYSRSRRKRRKPNSMTIVDYHIDGLFCTAEMNFLHYGARCCATLPFFSAGRPARPNTGYSCLPSRAVQK